MCVWFGFLAPCFTAAGQEDRGEQDALPQMQSDMKAGLTL